MNKILCFLIIVFLGAIFVDSADCKQYPSPMEQVRQKKKADGKYEFYMSDQEAEEFFNKLPELKIGEHYEQQDIVDLFGIPYTSYEIYGTIFFIKYTKRYEITYYIRKYPGIARPDLDIWVTLYFDKKKCLYSIVSNVYGVSRGGFADQIDAAMERFEKGKAVNAQ